MARAGKSGEEGGEGPFTGAVESDTTHDGLVHRITIPGGPLSASTADELVGLANRLREDRDVRVITLGSRSSPFCDGAANDLDPLSVDPDPAAALASLRPPIVAAVDGACLSVGLELVLATDIRVAGPTARFGFPDLADGRLPCWGGTQRLGRCIRPSEATSMVLLGSELDANRARSLGLVHEIDDDPATRVEALVEELVARGPLSLEFAKEAVHRGSELPLRDGLRLEGDLNHQLAATEDRSEGLNAFFDKRPPDFAGR